MILRQGDVRTEENVSKRRAQRAAS